MRLLFIGAHPADIVDLAAGTIKRHINAGDEVFTVAATIGLYSHPLLQDEMDQEHDIFHAKESETSGALDILGVPITDQFWIGADDGLLIQDDRDKVIIELADIIRNWKPDVLITHHPAESHHPNHSVIGQWTMEASVAAARFINWNYTELPRHTVSNIFFYGYQFHPSMVKLGRNVVPPDVVVDITEVIKNKAEAFMLMTSQYNTEKVVWSRLNSMEKEWGRQYGFEYAETFISYQPCRSKLLPDFGSSNFQELLKKQAKA